MKFILEVGDITYGELMDRLEAVVNKMRTDHTVSSKLGTGEKYYLMPSQEDFDEWDKEDK